MSCSGRRSPQVSLNPHETRIRMKLPGRLFAAVWVAGLFSFSLSQQDCNDGKPGLPGIPGRDGWPGQKGEKGEPGLQVHLSNEALAALKGEDGEPGPVGYIGVKGFQGDLGPPGLPGPPGPSGRSGDSVGGAGASKAAFSVLRTSKTTPSYNRPVTFDKAVTNVNDDFNLQTGYFTCKVAGVYYFVFHSVSEGNLCLQLKGNYRNAVDLTFCDFYQPSPRHISQVVSGGAVLQLAKGDKVRIEPIKNPDSRTESNKMTTKSEPNTVFSGFLVFATE